MENGTVERKQFRVCWGQYYRAREVEPYMRSLENQFAGSERRAKKLEEDLEISRQTVASRDREIEELREKRDENRSVLAEADEKLRQSREMREDAERQLAEFSVRQQEIEETARQMAEKAREAEEKTREAEEKTRNAEEKMREADLRMEEAERRAQQAEDRRKNAEQNIRDAEERLRSAEGRARDAESRYRDAENKAADAETRASDARRREEETESRRASILRDVEADRIVDTGKDEEIRRLRAENARLRSQESLGYGISPGQEELQMSLQQANDRNRILRAQVEQLESEIKEYEALLTNHSTKDAQARAQKIIQDALDQSTKILDEAEMIRARAFAATKAAYFNALMFRQQLAEQFTDIEQNLDNSLGILRSTDLVALSPRAGMEETAKTVWANTEKKKEWE